MEIAIAAVCVLVSALFSGTEVALFALRRVDREQLSRSSSSADQRVLSLLQQPRRLIATVLIANESVNAVLTVAGLQLVALSFAGLLAPWLIGVVTIAIMIPVIVLAGEVTPKTLALKAPLAWARATAGPLWIFSVAVAPVRLIVGGFVEVLLRPFGAAPRAGNRDLSEEEFRILIDASSAQGQVDARERRLIHKVFEFSDKSVGQIMTPRDRVFALSYDLPTARLLKEVAARGFSRVPIYQKSLDNVRGILNAKDLLRPSAGQAGRTLGELLHEPLFVPRTTPIKRVFLTFKQRKVHMAIVVNEYGKVLGLVTMDDVLAQLFGTLRDEREGLQAAGRRPRTSRTPAVGMEGIAPLRRLGGDGEDDGDGDGDGPGRDDARGRGDAGAAREDDDARGDGEDRDPREDGVLSAGEDVDLARDGETAAEAAAREAELDAEIQNVEAVVAVLAPAEAPPVFLAAPLSDSMRGRRPSRYEVHEEDTPPALDPSELTPPRQASGSPREDSDGALRASAGEREDPARREVSSPVPKLVDPREPTKPNREDER